MRKIIPVVLIAFVLVFQTDATAKKKRKKSKQPVAETQTTKAEEPMTDPMGVQVHTLANGLTVYLSENHEEPRISARIQVRAGAAQDPRDATGMAHYLEHMVANKGSQRMGTTDYEAERPHLERIRALYDELFTTTDADARLELYKQIDAESQLANKYSVPNEIKQLWGLMGGRRYNAFTNHDTTAYIVDMPANRLEHWARIEADRFATPVFRSFHTEVETVFEEKNRSMDKPSRALYDAMRALVFKSHPYGTSVLGDVEHVKNPSVSKTYEYFERWYVPGNMAVILAGDFDSAEALAVITEHLGKLPAKEVTAEERVAVPPLKGEERAEIVHHDDEQVEIIWQAVPFGHEDMLVVRVMDMLLNNASTGLLDVNLNQTQKVRKSGSAPWFGRLAGWQRVWGQPREGQTVEEVEALLHEQVQALKDGNFTQQDLDDIVLNTVAQEKRQAEYNSGRINHMANAFLYGIPWEVFAQRNELMAQVTREQVIEAANRYLGDNRAVVVRRNGQPELNPIEAPPITELKVDTEAHSELFAEIKALPVDAIEPQQLVAGQDYEVRETPAGLLYTTPNPYNDLAALQVTWRTGRGHDPGLCVAMGLWERSGVGEMDLEAINRELYRGAADLYTNCGHWSCTLTLMGPEESVIRLWPMVVERLQAPVLTEEDRTKHIEDKIAKRQDDLTAKGTQNRVLKSFARKGEDSPYLAHPADDEMRALTLDELVARPSALLGQQRVVYYTGNRPAEEIEALLVDPDGTYEPTPEVPTIHFLQPQETHILLLDFDSLQSDVTVVAGGEVYDTTHLPDYYMLGEYMGGNAGMVFQEIREARGFAYSAGAFYSRGARAGDETSFQAILGTQADKTAEASALLLEMVQQVPPDPDRHGRARDSVAEKLRTERITFRSIAYWAESWRRKGLDGDPRAGLLAELPEHTIEQLDGFAGRFEQQPLTIAILGDVDGIDMEALEAIAPVTRVTLEDLVSYPPVVEE